MNIDEIEALLPGITVMPWWMFGIGLAAFIVTGGFSLAVFEKRQKVKGDLHADSASSAKAKGTTLSVIAVVALTAAAWGMTTGINDINRQEAHENENFKAAVLETYGAVPSVEYQLVEEKLSLNTEHGTNNGVAVDFLIEDKVQHVNLKRFGDDIIAFDSNGREIPRVSPATTRTSFK